MSGLLNNCFVGGSRGYQIVNSLRFRGSATAFLSQTPTGAATDGTKLTFSAWIKRGRLSNALTDTIFGGDQGGGTSQYLYFGSDDKLHFDTAGVSHRVSPQVFRDIGAWYHLLFVADTGNATENDRLRAYINGSRITWTTGTAYTQNAVLQFMKQSTLSDIGRAAGSASALVFDGYMAEIYCVDGQTLTPGSFGQTDAVTGQWIPKRYAGTYGTNGFYLPFNDGSNLTNLCLDRSGNGNNWTANNISLTAGATYDWMTDTPTNNYCTFSSIDGHINKSTPSAANLECLISAGANATYGQIGTIGVTSGKWYWEVTILAKESTGAQWLGVGTVTANTDFPSGTFAGAKSGGYEYLNDGSKYGNGTGPTAGYGSTYAVGDIIGVALDVDSGTIAFYKNNTSQGVAFSSMGSGPHFPISDIYRSNLSAQNMAYNFGQRPFTYTPPTGYKALCTQNLPVPAIKKGALHFDALTQLGSAVSTGAALLSQFSNFVADFAWGKDRSAANNHQLVDTVRGNTAILLSNSTGTETTYSAPTAGDNCIAWGWKAGGASVTNNAGSIQSQVSANTTAGFSIVTFVPNQTAGATVGHGLGVAPGLVIGKPTTGGTGGWPVFHKSLGGTQWLALQTPNAATTSNQEWNNTAPTSTVVTVGGAGSNINGTSYTKSVLYCFAEVPGFSKFGSYTGNGSADGPFIYCGFRPRFVMSKRVDAAGDWYMYDTARSGYNVQVATMAADSNLGEASFTATNYFDFLSNGFKLRQDNSSGYNNASGGTYIFMAFAESPFNYANAR